MEKFTSTGGGIVRAGTFGDGLPDCPNSRDSVLGQAPQSLHNNGDKIHPSGTAIGQVGCHLALHTHVQGMAGSGRSCTKGKLLEGRDNVDIKSGWMTTMLDAKEDVSWS